MQVPQRKIITNNGEIVDRSVVSETVTFVDKSLRPVEEGSVRALTEPAGIQPATNRSR